MPSVLSILRSNPVAAIGDAISSDHAARLADMRARPWDYELPDWVNRAGEWLKYFRTEEGEKMRKKIITAIIAAGGILFIYRRYQAARSRQVRDLKYEKEVLNAIGDHRPIPTPSPDSTMTQESIGDRLIHIPDDKGLISVPTKSAGEKGDKGGKQKVAVDAVFFRRLGKILHIVIPSVYSTEMAYVIILTILLFARTFFSIYIAELIGKNAQSLVSRKWGRMLRGLRAFALITIPASAVNAGLKFYAEMVSLRFRKRLSEYVHDEYLAGSNFYKASNLGGESRIDNADQRVTADIANFSEEIAQLYTSLLKPLLDVVLFTYKLQTILGWQGPAAMHSYFILSGIVKKKIMPNLGKLVARESELEGYYRTAHNRLITNSEEIAFYDGSKKEKVIINNALQMICSHIAYARWMKALIGVFDGLLVKYYASIAGYCTLLSPFIFMHTSDETTTADLTRDYIRNSQYLGQLSTAVGQLLIVGNKLTSIAGYTSRVSELLEQVKHLNAAGNVPFEVKEEAPHVIENVEKGSAYSNFISEWRQRADAQTEMRLAIRHEKGSGASTHVVGGGEIRVGEDIIFEHVDIVSPEGKLLVKDLNFSVIAGTNVMVTGPNGVGKSSLFRIIGELWPLHCGVLTKPLKEQIMFIPQKAYLVLGTLRDQIIYPHDHTDMKRLGVTDNDLEQLLAIVDPARNILNEWSWDTVKDWFHAFSGGQKQRIAMARLFYHKPKFAILDECTSAVSDEVEGTIYSTARLLGITIFTVSHRPQLAKYHDLVLRFEGATRWSVQKIDANKEVEKEKKEKELMEKNTTNLTTSQQNDSLAPPTTASASATTTEPSSSTSTASATAPSISSEEETQSTTTTNSNPNPNPVTTSSNSNGHSKNKKRHNKH